MDHKFKYYLKEKVILPRHKEPEWTFTYYVDLDSTYRYTSVQDISIVDALMTKYDSIDVNLQYKPACRYFDPEECYNLKIKNNYDIILQHYYDVKLLLRSIDVEFYRKEPEVLLEILFN